MATAYPGAIDSFTNPLSTDDTNTVSHALQHLNANGAVIAVETKIGSGASTPTSGKILAGNGTGTSAWVSSITNLTLVTPTIASIVNSGTLTLPTSTDTLVGKATTDVLTNKTLTSPKIGTSILDTNGVTLLTLTATASAVNNLILANQIAGSYPSFTAAGSDTDIGIDLAPKGAGPVRVFTTTGKTPTIQGAGADSNLDLVLSPKGTGKINMEAVYSTAQTYSPAGGGTATLDLRYRQHQVTVPAGNITIAVSNATVGQWFVLRFVNDASVRTLTWFATLKWANGTVGTLSGSSVVDAYVFYVKSANNYEGYVIGQNVS